MDVNFINDCEAILVVINSEPTLQVKNSRSNAINRPVQPVWKGP